MELTHHGILGQKWGVRRYQRRDGTLTPLGKLRLEAAVGDHLPSTSHRVRRSAIDKRDGIGVRHRNKLFANRGVNRASDEFLEKYSSATLKDAKLHDSQAGRSYVKKCVAFAEARDEHELFQKTTYYSAESAYREAKTKLNSERNSSAKAELHKKNYIEAEKRYQDAMAKEKSLYSKVRKTSSQLDGFDELLGL